MSIETNLRGRLKNTSLPIGKGLHPVFEAVANSLQSLAALYPDDTSRGEIRVEILRLPQLSLESADPRSKSWFPPMEPIVGFKIVDDGIGFDDVNFKSFEILDTEHKSRDGCRGVGRLLWLKAFKRAHVHSVYLDSTGAWKRRSFTFDDRQGVSKPVVEDAPNGERRTEVHLDGFTEMYRDRSVKTSEAIARSIFENCLWYFLRDGGAPRIVVVDGPEAIDLEGVYNDYMMSGARKSKIKVQGHTFELTHLKLRTSTAKAPFISWTAAGRMVEEEAIRSFIPGLLAKVRDPEGDFVYACHVTSPYLNRHVRPERIGFDMPEQPDLQTDGEVSRSELRDAVIESAKKFLEKHLDEGKQASRARVEEFVSTRAPRYRPILARIDQDKLMVDPQIADKDLDLLLHKQFAEIEGDLLIEGQTIMNFGPGETIAGYRTRLKSYLEKVQDIKLSDLAGYVFHRKIVLDILEKAIERDDQNKFVREDLIHQLIMPMRRTSDEVLSDKCNLWLVDERLAFHAYLASDKPLSSMPFVDTSENKEPDLLALNIFDQPMLVSNSQLPPFAALTIVEIKRPGRNDAAPGEEKDPIEQCIGYLNRVREGGAKRPGGREIPNAQEIPGFCYVIADLTPTVVHRCKMVGLHRRSDGMGYFGYNEPFKAYIEVTSYDGVLRGASERNRAFFDRLGLPTA